MNYLDNYKAYLISINKAPHTIKQYGIDVEHFISYMNKSNLSFENKQNKLLEEYIDYLNETYQSIKTYNRKLASLKHFLAFLKSREIIQDISQELLLPKRLDENEIKTFQPNQLKKVINYWLEIYERSEDTIYKWIALRNFCIVRMISELSLKPSEVVEMKWSHINEQEIIIIKRKGSRRVEVSSKMLEWLQIYQKATEDIQPLSVESDFIWLGIGNKQNEPITVKTIERLFQAISKKLGFKATATMLRYSTINNESTDENLDEVYSQFGYTRKSVLKDRLKRFT